MHWKHTNGRLHKPQKLAIGAIFSASLIVSFCCDTGTWSDATVKRLIDESTHSFDTDTVVAASLVFNVAAMTLKIVFVLVFALW